MGEYVVGVGDGIFEVRATTHMTTRHSSYSIQLPKALLDGAGMRPLLVSPSEDMVQLGIWFPTFIVQGPVPDAINIILKSTTMGVEKEVQAHFHIATLVIL